MAPSGHELGDGSTANSNVGFNALVVGLVHCCSGLKLFWDWSLLAKDFAAALGTEEALAHASKANIQLQPPGNHPMPLLCALSVCPNLLHSTGSPPPPPAHLPPHRIPITGRPHHCPPPLITLPHLPISFRLCAVYFFASLPHLPFLSAS